MMRSTIQMKIALTKQGLEYSHWKVKKRNRADDDYAFTSSEEAPGEDTPDEE